MTHRMTGLATALLLLGSIAACGGSDHRSPGASAPPPATGGGGDDPVSGIPVSASASVDGYIAYLRGLAGQTDETGRPLSVAGFTPPVSETAGPTALQ